MYASHFYGTLRFGDEEITVYYKLTKADAARFNKTDSTALSKFKPGDNSSRFIDENKLIKEAILLFEKDNHGYDVLIKGDNCSCDPQEILVGPDEIKVKANKLNDLFDQEGGWGPAWEPTNQDKIQDICDQWTALVGPIWENEK